MGIEPLAAVAETHSISVATVYQRPERSYLNHISKGVKLKFALTSGCNLDQKVSSNISNKSNSILTRLVLHLSHNVT